MGSNKKLNKIKKQVRRKEYKLNFIAEVANVEKPDLIQRDLVFLKLQHEVFLSLGPIMSQSLACMPYLFNKSNR